MFSDIYLISYLPYNFFMQYQKLDISGLSNCAKETQLSSHLNLKKPTRETEFQQKYKTEMCKNWEAGHCEYGDKCAFAHGNRELRSKVQVATNKKCKQFAESGYCLLGSRCQFDHCKESDTACSSPANTPRSRKGSDPPFSFPIFIDLETRGI